MSNKLKFNPVTGKLDLVESFDASEIEKDPEVRQETLDALTDSKQAKEGDTLTVDENGHSKWKEGFNPQGNYPNLSVGFAHDITPEESDAISDNTAFVWQTSGGSANIPASSTAIIKKICGYTVTSSNDAKLHSFKATNIRSRIYNLFDYTNVSRKRVGYMMQGKSIVPNAISTLFWIPCLYGQDNGNNGYYPTPADDLSIAEIGWYYCGWCENEPTEDTTEVDVLLQHSQHGNSDSYLPTQNGWLVFSLLTEHEADLCLHFCWSGYNDNKFEPYVEDNLVLPDVVASGLNGIGSVYDEVNNETYVKRIGEANTKDLVWIRWTQQIYDPSTGTMIEQFLGYKTSSLADVIKKETTNINIDVVYQLYGWQTDENGTLFVMCDTEDEEWFEQLTEGRTIIYELDEYEIIEISFAGLLNVGDFGDMKFEGVEYVGIGMGGTVPLAPYAVEIKYGVNYRDTIRSIANSGCTFSKNGITTSGLFFGPETPVTTLSGTTTLSIDDVKRFLTFTLTGSVNTINLPKTKNPFSFQIVIIQDATGGRDLAFACDGATVANPSEFDFAVGEPNQLTVVTLVWLGESVNKWIFEATKYCE